MDLTKKIKKTLPEDTLLRQFLIREIESYDVPERKGTKRGDLIGLTLPMFVAAVLRGITNIQLKKIADISGANYGSLLHTVREKRFLDVADGWHGMFAVYVAQYMVEKVKELQKAMSKGKDFYELIAATPPIFNDAYLYKDTLPKQIAEIYFKHFTSAGSLIACPRELFARVVRIIFSHVDYAGRIAERAYLDRVNEFLRLNSRKLQPKVTLDPMIAQLNMLYIELEWKYQEETRKAK